MRCESESDFLLLCKSKIIVGLVMHQDGISEKECFGRFLVLILADSKSGAIRRLKEGIRITEMRVGIRITVAWTEMRVGIRITVYVTEMRVGFRITVSVTEWVSGLQSLGLR